ncbi:ricin-type beta-trefoil lectin domain protein [Kribbella sp. NPDC056861]|uniref:ricin-type beta-trefoil lectin domain protein n=1 Tax=Kribbella sp. NPDC056861 TaxID=3154857 RepID=UPI00343CF875
MPSDRPDPLRKPDAGFSSTFARRPAATRVSELPSLRAIRSTAALAGLLAVAVFGVSIVVKAVGAEGSTVVDSAANLPGSSTRPTTPAATTPRPTTAPSAPKGTQPVQPRQPTVTATVIRPGVVVTAPAPVLPQPRSAQAVPQPAPRATAQPRTPVRRTPVTTTVKKPGSGSKKTTTSTKAPLKKTVSTPRTTPLKPTVIRPKPAPTRGTGIRIRNVGSNRCVDVAHGSSGSAVDGARLQVWNCNGASNQTWRFYSDGTIRSLGKCMDLAQALTLDGTTIGLFTCNGTWAQQWRLGANGGNLYNPTAKKCAYPLLTSNGGRIVLRPCSSSKAMLYKTP